MSQNQGHELLLLRQVCMLPGPEGQDEEFWLMGEDADLEHVAMLQVCLKINMSPCCRLALD